jgi:hypothetical protein
MGPANTQRRQVGMCNSKSVGVRMHSHPVPSLEMDDITEEIE